MGVGLKQQFFVQLISTEMFKKIGNEEVNQRLSVVEECLHAVNFLSDGLVGVLVRNSCGSSPDNNGDSLRSFVRH